MSKKVLLSIVAFLLILGGGSAAAYYYFTSTPKNEYLLSELKSYESINNYLEKRFEPEYKLQKEMVDSSYDANVTIGANVPQELTDLMGIPNEMVNGSTIKFNIAHDPKQLNSKLSVTPKIANTDIGTIGWSADKERQYLETPVFDKPLTVKNDAIIKGIEKLTGQKMNVTGQQNITNETLNLNTILGSATTEVDSKAIVERYMKLIVDQIDESKFTKDSGQVSILGSKKKLKNITLSLNGDDVKKIVVAVLEKAKDDKELEAAVKKSSPETNYKKAVEDTIKSAKEETKYPSFKSVIYLDGKDIQKREISITTADKETFEVVLDTVIDKDIEMKLEVPNKDNKSSFILEGSSKGQGTVKDVYTGTYTDESGKYSTKLTNDEKLDGNKRTDNLSLVVDGVGAESYTINFKNESDVDAKNNTQKTKGELSFDMNGSMIKVLIDSDTKIKAPVTVDIKDAQDVNDMSKADIEKLEATIEKNFNKLNLESIGGF